jgi:hypothetical protein
MTLEQVFFASQSIAAVGVVASLIFVGLEVRNNSKAVRSGTAQRVHENYADWYLTLACNPSAITIGAKGLEDFDGLSRDEKPVFIFMFMTFMAHAQNTFHQWRDGPLAEELWVAWESLTFSMLHTPGGAAFWRERSYIFSKEFRAEAALIMSRPANPLAKAFGIVPVGAVTPAQVAPGPAL